MATKAQIEAVIKLHGTKDGADVQTQYPFSEGGAVQANKTTYDVIHSDPYEKYNAEVALAEMPIAPITVDKVTNGTALTLDSSTTETGQVDSVVEYDSTIGTGALTFHSDDEGSATVDASGLVTAISAGTPTITATSVEDVTKSGTTLVTVS